MRRGKFITIEGIEGVGKSTHRRFIAERIADAGLVVCETREPGGTELAERIRGILLDPALPGMTPMAELLLMFAARAEHLARIIVPALGEGQWVVCDRFTDASYAYQGGGRGVPSAAIAALERLVQEDVRPDLTVLLDAPVAVALARASKRAGADRFEAEAVGFFERVRRRYLELAAKEPQRILAIDASGTIDAVREAIATALATRLP